MPKEAPEGIVAYSWSGITPAGDSFFADGSPFPVYTPNDLQSKVNNGKIGQIASNIYIDYADTLGQDYKNTEKLVLAKNFIETLDMVSEGRINGLVQGEYIYSGNYGQTGWSTAAFSGYSVPTGADSFGTDFSNYRYLRSIYYNEVPILSDKAQFNFQISQAETSIRMPTYTEGLEDGFNLATIDIEETTSRTIGVRLRKDVSQTFRIINKNCKGVIVNVKVPSLSRTKEDTGNIHRVKLEWQISYRPIFTNVTKQSDYSAPIIETIFGKIISAGGYVRSTRVDFNVSSFFSKETSVTDASSNPIGTKTVITTNYIGNFLDNPDFLGWEIKIERLSPDSTTSLQQDLTYIDSFTELYGSEFRYPNSAIVRNTFNAEFFSQIPERAFEIEGIKVKIPGNYHPELRNYLTTGFATTNGFWNGLFATGYHYTNNPAWCFHDILTNKRYGLGRYIDNLNVDKFGLYKIGQYCDELVYTAEGGLEPRFTCNLWIGGREEAYKVVNDLASIFRGITYYAHGNLYSICDQPKTPRVEFTNANVENGDFSYTSTSKKARQSIAIVRYINPQDFYKPAIEYVEDVDAIRKYGIRELDLVAFGCTSRGQAIRLGRWALLSNNMETETIQFVGGLESATLRPGDIFKVHDTNRKTKRFGGRLWNYSNIDTTGALFTLDSTIPFESGIQYKMTVLTPSYYYDSSQVTGLTDADYSNIRRSFLQDFYFSGDWCYNSSNKTIVSATGSLDNSNYTVGNYPVWSVELGPNSSSYTGSRYFSSSESDYYRTINIREAGTNKYEIVGLKYWEQKFKEIDSGINFQRPSISMQTRTPANPSDLSLSLYSVGDSSDKIVHYSFLVNNFNFINNYKVYAITGTFSSSLPDNDTLVALLPPDVLQSTYIPNSSGAYNFRVYSYNETDNIYSNGYAAGLIQVDKGLPITDVIISSLQIQETT